MSRFLSYVNNGAAKIFKPAMGPGMFNYPSFASHASTCPGSRESASVDAKTPKRLPPGKVRFGFLPDEWFLFFHPQTGVSGPYIFGLVFINYLVSKEIYVMEHEYYSGISIALMIIFATKKFGKQLGESLDKEVDAHLAMWQNTRDTELNHYKNSILVLKTQKKQALGQELLMSAKKENIAMQLEAVYRERMMHVYYMIRKRLEYQVRMKKVLDKVRHKWIAEWTLLRVMESITPELAQSQLTSAIKRIEVAGEGLSF